MKDFLKKKIKIKLSKNKKIILLISGLGILTTSIVTPIVVINNKNNNQEKENKNDVEKVIKTLEEKTVQQRTIILPSDSIGNIIANNKEKIILKLKELICNLNLKNISIKVSMNQDQEISTSEQEIIVKVSKGNHSKIVSSSKAYFVNRTRTAQEIISNQKAQEIIAKIKDKDILIPANVSTQNQSEIQNAIKGQLKKENQTLNEDDLSKIAINNIESLTLDKKIEITIIIKVRNTIKKLIINVEKINLLKNSNVKDGERGTIFQDSFGNIWVMGKNTKLQVLKANHSKDGYENEGWTDVTTKELLKGSNIINGENGTIFQDSFKNLWTMSIGKNLQVLKINDSKNGYVSTGWTDDKNQGLLKGSNITKGEYGTIFQDSFKNLWATGNKTPLQVLKANLNGDGYENKGWTNVTNEGLLKGSIITHGHFGKIFQDSFKNLWTMSIGKNLQVLKANHSKDGYVESWTYDNTQGLLKGSNIYYGLGGTIFQDLFGNLWSMGHNKKLQVLKANSNGDGYVESWTDDNNEGLLIGSNIIDGRGGHIFQDSFKNLWAIGKETKLQVLKANSNGDGYVNVGWTDVNNIPGLLNGSNITNGEYGKIFQDSFKNLWTMGKGKKLQVLKVNSNGDGYVSEGWTDVNNIPGLLNGSNITNGEYGTIFQDSFKNLWAIGKETKLQVFIANSDNSGYINSWV